MAWDMAAAGHEPLGWSRPARDLYFVLQQPGVTDVCRAHRLLGDKASGQDLARNLFLVALRQVGDAKDPGDAYLEQWLADIGLPGTQLVDRAYQTLAHPTRLHEEAFKASRVYDPQTKSYAYTIPAECMPKASKAERSFSIRELTVRQTADAADACEDPDDGYAIRVLQIMWSISRIGSRALSFTPDDLLVRRRWLSAIGNRAFMMLAGTYSRMHEVERSLVDRFLGTAASPA